MDLGEEELAALFRGGYLHDVGKVGIPDEILLKPGRLTDSEYQQIQEHPVIGDRLCGELRSLRQVRPIVRHHHERLDGSGYPDGLKGDAIPLLAQIMGIVDVYDAITTTRPYKPAASPEQAYVELMQEVNQGWRRRDLVDAFIALKIEHGRLEGIQAVMTELKRIVLAEDNANDVELTLAALGEINLANEVVVVRDGAETLDYLYRRNAYAGRPPGNPAVLLLDLKMPKVDGLDVLRALKADEALKTIPVVMLTSSREEQDLVRSYKLGANAYVVKPVDFRVVHRRRPPAWRILGRRQRTSSRRGGRPNIIDAWPEWLAHRRKVDGLDADRKFVHDMKNMMGIIIGYSNLVLDEMPADDPERPDIDEIRKAEKVRLRC